MIAAPHLSPGTMARGAIQQRTRWRSSTAHAAWPTSCPLTSDRPAGSRDPKDENVLELSSRPIPRLCDEGIRKCQPRDERRSQPACYPRQHLDQATERHSTIVQSELKHPLCAPGMRRISDVACAWSTSGSARAGRINPCKPISRERFDSLRRKWATADSAKPLTPRSPSVGRILSRIKGFLRDLERPRRKVSKKNQKSALSRSSNRSSLRIRS